MNKKGKNIGQPQKKVKKMKRRVVRGEDYLATLNNVRIPKALLPASPFPMEMTRALLFNEENLLLQDSSNSWAMKEWRISDVWDPDPALGGGSVSGFTELIAIYSEWVVERFATTFTVVNNEPALPISFGLIFRDSRPSATITNFNSAVSALEVGPSFGPFSCGETTGMSRFGPRKVPPIHPAAILGNPIEYFADLDYHGHGSATPTDPMWMAFILYTHSGLNLTNGCFFTFLMRFTTRFYSKATVVARKDNVTKQSVPRVVVSNDLDVSKRVDQLEKKLDKLLSLLETK